VVEGALGASQRAGAGPLLATLRLAVRLGNGRLGDQRPYPDGRCCPAGRLGEIDRVGALAEVRGLVAHRREDLSSECSVAGGLREP
jgi:hypothetical protein